MCDARRRVFARCARRLPRIASHTTSLLLSPAPPALQSRPRAPHLHPLGIPSHFPACLQEFFSLTLSLPLPPSQALGGRCFGGARGTRLADRRARRPVGPSPRLWAVRIRSLPGERACILFGSVACTCARVGCVPCRRPFNSVRPSAGSREPLWMHVVVAHL